MSPWPYPRVLAHRGGGAFAPENTIAAIRVGREYGFRGVEFDVTLSADEQPVLIHDATLDRTTDGSGRVADHGWAELARLDAGSWFSSSFAGEPIPRLAQVVDYCRSHPTWFNAEIKPAPGSERRTGERVATALALAFADRLLRDAAGAGPPDPQVPLLSSFSGEALAGALHAAPQLPRALLCSRIPDDWREQLQQLACVALHCDHRHLDARQVEAIRGAGFWVLCYTVNQPARARELALWGIDALCTDRLDRVGAAFFEGAGGAVK
jgi:glycerophosphoryl diester phosphodiesterase